MTLRALPKVDRLLHTGRPDGPVLALDTSTRLTVLGVVATAAGEHAFAAESSSQAASLPLAVERFLGETGLSFRDLRGLVVATGPGSFTGLRVGLSYARGLSSALDIPLVGVPTFDAVAMAAVAGAASQPDGTMVCSLADARGGEFYAAFYRLTPEGLACELEPALMSLEALTVRMEGHDVILAVPGNESVSGLEALARKAVCCRRIDKWGSELAALGAFSISAGQKGDSSGALPLYLGSNYSKPSSGQVRTNSALRRRA